MTQINLLPWREKQREQDKKIFTTLIIAAALGSAALVFMVYLYSIQLINNQTERNSILKKEIKILDADLLEIKELKTLKQALIARMSIIQNLQSTRTLMVHLFDELIKVVPSGIYITQLERKNDIVTLYGYSESNTNISILMRNIEINEWIQAPALTEIKKMNEKKEPENNEFRLSFILKPKY